MDEFRTHLHRAVEAAADGDLQALLIARWMLQTLYERRFG